MNPNRLGLRAPQWAPLALSLSLGLGALAACQSSTSPVATAPAERGQEVAALKTIPVGAAPHGIAAAQGFVYNSDVGAKQISVIDAATDAVVKVIPFGPEGTPGYLYAIRGGSQVLGTDTAKGEVFLLAAGSHEILWRLPVGPKPDKIVAAPDGRKAWVSLVGAPEVVEVFLPEDPKQAASIARRLAVGNVVGTDHRALALAGGWLATVSTGTNQANFFDLSAAGGPQNVEARLNPGPIALATVEGVAKSALVGLIASHELLHVALPGGTGTRIAEVGQAPSDIAYDPITQRAFATMSGSNEVAVVDMTQAKLIARIAVGDRPVHAYLAPALPPRAFELMHEGEDHGATATAAASGTASPDAHAGHGEVAASATPTPLPASPVPTLLPGASGADGGAEIWVSNDRGTTVSVIDARSLRVKATLLVGKGHRKMAFLGDKAYVSNIGDNSVSVIDRRAIR